MGEQDDEWRRGGDVGYEEEEEEEEEDDGANGSGVERQVRARSQSRTPLAQPRCRLGGRSHDGPQSTHSWHSSPTTTEERTRSARE